MKVNAQILDSRDEGTSQCFLSRITLEDYVNGLPSTYQDYDVQREIVTNVYLDHLVDTVLENRHIPPIVLVVTVGKFQRVGDRLEISEFKILDGLQRTFRLQAIKQTIQYALDNIIDPQNYLGWNKFKFSREFSEAMRKLNSNTDVLRSVLQGMKDLGKEGLKNTFSANGQWFEIWTGLTPDEEVRKMLTLNAGHKPVKTRHQLELLFLNLLPVLRSGEGAEFQLVREKEVNATQFSKNRVCGSFHFAHIITSLLSFYAAKPVATSTSLIQDLQNRDTSLEENSEFISPALLADFVAFLVRLDKLLFDQYGEFGVLWMGREVSLAGLFGALGSAAENSDGSRLSMMWQLWNILNTQPGVLNLEQFEQVRNSLDLSKVNIGNANRAAVFTAIKSLLGNATHQQLDWHDHFRSAEGK